MIYYAGGKPSNELYHHGILGQKWGVRRYQNKDGSYTNAGRERYGISIKKTAEKTTNVVKSEANKAGNAIKNMDPNTKKKIIAGVGISAAAIATAVYLYKNPEKIANLGSKIKESSSKLENKGKEYVNKKITDVKEHGKEYAKNKFEEFKAEAKKETIKVTKRVIGAMAIKKLSEHYEKNLKNNPDLSDTLKTVYKIANEEGTNYIRNKTSGNQNLNNGNVPKSIKQKVGEPKNVNNKINRNSSEWGDFMSGLSKDEKNTARQMANAGYSYDQIRKGIK